MTDTKTVQTAPLNQLPATWGWEEFARVRFMERFEVSDHKWMEDARFKDDETQQKWLAYLAGWEDMKAEIGVLA